MSNEYTTAQYGLDEEISPETAGLDPNTVSGLTEARELGLPQTRRIASALVSGFFEGLKFGRNPDGTINLLPEGNKESKFAQLDVSVENFQSVLSEWLNRFGGN